MDKRDEGTGLGPGRAKPRLKQVLASEPEDGRTERQAAVWLPAALKNKPHEPHQLPRLAVADAQNRSKHLTADSSWGHCFSRTESSAFVSKGSPSPPTHLAYFQRVDTFRDPGSMSESTQACARKPLYRETAPKPSVALGRRKLSGVARDPRGGLRKPEEEEEEEG